MIFFVKMQVKHAVVLRKWSLLKLQEYLQIGTTYLCSIV